jgi:hypothetical protein
LGSASKEPQVFGAKDRTALHGVAQFEDKTVDNPLRLQIAQASITKQSNQDAVIALEHLAKEQLIRLVFAQECPQLRDNQTAVSGHIFGYDLCQNHLQVLKNRLKITIFLRENEKNAPLFQIMAPFLVDVKNI